MWQQEFIQKVCLFCVILLKPWAENVNLRSNNFFNHFEPFSWKVLIILELALLLSNIILGCWAQAFYHNSHASFQRMTHPLTRAPTHKIQLCWCQTCLSNLISSILQQKKIEQLLALVPLWSMGLYSPPQISDMCDARVMTIIGSVKESCRIACNQPVNAVSRGLYLWPALLSRLPCNCFPNREPPANIQL